MSNPFNIPASLPTYGLKYRIGGQCRHGNTFIAHVYKRGHLGSVTDKIGGTENNISLNFSYADNDFFREITGYRCEIAVLGDHHLDLLELQDAQEKDYRVIVTDGNNQVFIGFHRPAMFQLDYGSVRPQIRIVATDGLGMLKNQRFTLGKKAPTSGVFYLKDIISYMLYQAGNQGSWQDITPFRANTGGNFNYLGSAKMPVFDFYNETLYEVLRKVLKQNLMQLLQENGMYMVRMIDHPSANLYDEYSHQGAYIQSDNFTPPFEVLTNAISGPSGTVRSEVPTREVTIVHKQDYIENLVYNHDFSIKSIFTFNGIDRLFPTGWYFDQQPGIDASLLADYMSLPVYDSGTPRYLYANVARGPRQGMRLEVEVEVKLSSEWLFDEDFRYYIHLSLGYDSNGNTHDVMSEVVTGAKWQTVSIVMPVCQTNTDGDMLPLRLYGFSFLDVPPAGNHRLHIKSAQVHLLAHVDPAINLSYSEVVNENNIDDIEFEMNYENARLYRYHGALDIGRLEYRKTGEVARMREWIQERLIGFYKDNRIRLNLSGLLFAGKNISALTRIADNATRKRYAVLSVEYGVKQKNVSLDLVEIGDYHPPESITAPWIMADGTWNMQGIWKDEPFYFTEP